MNTKKHNVKLATAFVAMYFLIFLFGVMMGGLYAQVGINTTGNNPHSSAALDINFTSKGLLIPRMTTAERDAIPSPATSLLIYNTTTGCFEFWDSSNWIALHPCAGGCIPPTGVTAVATPNPICVGETLNLSGSATDGATSWSWTGPNGFTSTLQNPTIPNITTAGAGVYTLTASNACGSATATTAAVTVNNCPKIYAIGGHNGAVLTTNEEYNPATNTWTTKATYAHSKRPVAAAVVNNKVYAIGGYEWSSIINQ